MATVNQWVADYSWLVVFAPVIVPAIGLGLVLSIFGWRR